jgi:hypothetical protein
MLAATHWAPRADGHTRLFQIHLPCRSCWLGSKWGQLCQSMKAAMFRSATAARSEDARQGEPTSLMLNVLTTQRGRDSAAWFKTHIVHIHSIIAGLASQHAMPSCLLRIDLSTAVLMPITQQNKHSDIQTEVCMLHTPEASSFSRAATLNGCLRSTMHTCRYRTDHACISFGSRKPAACSG